MISSHRSEVARILLRYFLAVLLILCFDCRSSNEISLPGRLDDGRVLLPNGWYLSPAGAQIDVGDLPLNIDISPDGRFAIVTNNGYSNQGISVVDLQARKVIRSVPLTEAWLGLKFIEGGKRFVVSGGNSNKILIYDFREGDPRRVDSVVLGPPWPKEKIWIAGIDVDSRGRLFAACRENRAVYAIDLASRSILKKIRLSAMPYTCLVSKTTPNVYVSLWGGAAVTVIDGSALDTVRTIHVGQHPCDMAESPDGKRLFVAESNGNTVSVIDCESWKVTESLSSSITPDAPPGSTPNAVALSPDGTRLYIANADNNSLAVMDVSVPGSTRSLGFIPTGWYPDCVRVNRATGEILVANGKGLSSSPNPLGPNPVSDKRHPQYIGSLFRGTLLVISPPPPEELRKYTAEVYANSPRPTDTVSGSARNTSASINYSAGNRVKHVFYIIKENRTYDQVFGDLPQGNGDPSLCLFGRKVTPNIHALAEQFVLLDNLYADAEVSADGHSWSMGAYANDYVEKSWPTQYSDRGGEYDYEGDNPIAAPLNGYIWDNCRRHGISYRSYGEFTFNAEKEGDSARAEMPSLEGHVAPFFQGWDLDYSDLDRVKAWEKEFAEYERTDDLPQFEVIRLPNDHTYGAAKGKATPRAFVAQNDLALGLLVERISHSRFWNESAIFVIEDDAQNGPDHVDAHRTEALVIGPYVKRGYVDHEMTSTSGMLHAMELILGLPPMTQFDASAPPLGKCFTEAPDLTPFAHLRNEVDLGEMNPPNAYGQLRSGEMNFSREDATPERELNEIVWRSVRGAESPIPPPRRSAFFTEPAHARAHPDIRWNEE